MVIFSAPLALRTPSSTPHGAGRSDSTSATCPSRRTQNSGTNTKRRSPTPHACQGDDRHCILGLPAPSMHGPRSARHRMMATGFSAQIRQTRRRRHEEAGRQVRWQPAKASPTPSVIVRISRSSTLMLMFALIGNFALVKISLRSRGFHHYYRCFDAR